MLNLIGKGCVAVIAASTLLLLVLLGAFILILNGGGIGRSPTPSPALTPAAASPAAAPPQPATPAGGQSPVARSPEVLRYMADLRAADQKLVESLERFVTLMSSPRPLDSNWRSEVIAESSSWRAMDAEWKERIPPAGLGTLHAQWMESLSHFSEAAVTVDRIGRTGDVRLVDQATQEYNAGVESLNRLNEQMAGYP